ncbi:hypothetical protein SAMN05192552_103753 [Natrinema hispanicum]|uniref:Uncharacterized protein n=1 Tax=Natrinema hispanicum TaxID=392421 RepID=A0A1I0JNU0_9EURY|nr:hypothetical protein SAMN05192552_103753 [Natrinema hispanicum]SEU11500.1 hypothetical protein SAMN04488694_1504 [Natrinema hispanicum]
MASMRSTKTKYQRAITMSDQQPLSDLEARFDIKSLF